MIVGARRAVFFGLAAAVVAVTTGCIGPTMTDLGHAGLVGTWSADGTLTGSPRVTFDADGSLTFTDVPAFVLRGPDEGDDPISGEGTWATESDFHNSAYSYAATLVSMPDYPGSGVYVYVRGYRTVYFLIGVDPDRTLDLTRVGATFLDPF
jgi:hypothetical protein